MLRTCGRFYRLGALLTGELRLCDGAKTDMQQCMQFTVLLPEVALTQDRGWQHVAGRRSILCVLQGTECCHSAATCAGGSRHVTGSFLTGGHAGVQSGGRLRIRL